MAIPKEYKRYLFQTVHCSGYIKQNKHWRYYLKKMSGYWYCYNHQLKEFGRQVTSDPITWIWNANFDFIEKEFSGVVTKIYSVAVSSILGIIEDSEFPKKEYGLVMMVCDIYFRNGGKRTVPFECITEHEQFNGGANILKHLAEIQETFNNKSEYVVDENGIIKITNTSNYIDRQSFKLEEYKQTALFDMERNNVTVSNGRQSVFVSESVYKDVCEILEKKALEKTRCHLQLSWGNTYFQKLRSFTLFPYAPQLEYFGFLFTEPETQELMNELKSSSNCIRQFIEICGVNYSPFINKLLLEGPENFAQYMGIINSGFTDTRAVDLLLYGDESLAFAKFFRESFYFTKNEYLPEIQPRGDVPEFIKDVFFIRSLYDQEKASKLVVQLTDKEDSSTKDIVEYMRRLRQENLLNSKMIKKIGKEGFTPYTHNLLQSIYFDVLEKARQENERIRTENLTIDYSEEEKRLEWNFSGYAFCLPENTDRLLDIGNSMNICVGHLYMEPAVEKKCTIVYVTKNNDYVLCIEVQKECNRFYIAQKSAFGNASPKGEDLAVFNRWRITKGIR